MPGFVFDPDRSVWVLGEISYNTYSTVVASFAEADQRDSSKDLQLHITSPGGTATVGFAIYDFLQKFIKSPVVTVASGECHSIAVLLLQAGARRLSHPNTSFLLHCARSSPDSSVSFRRKDLVALQGRIDAIDAMYVKVLCEKTGLDSATWRGIIEKETYLTVQDALNLHLIDEII